jgi:flagellar FliL protein
MIRKLIPILLPVVAILVATILGEISRGPEGSVEVGHGTSSPDAMQAATPAQDEGPQAWFSFSAQFFVPLIRNNVPAGTMILSLSLETRQDQLGALAREEPRLRDAILRELLIKANEGFFDRNFTSEDALVELRDDLFRASRQATDLPVSTISIEGIHRQAG